MTTSRDNQSQKREGSFAQRFEARVAHLGVKDADIARKTGISTSALSRYRAGGAPKAEHLFALADALQCSPRWLITGDENEVEPSQSEVVNLPVARDVSASAGDGAFALEYSDIEPVPFPKDWLRGLGDPAQLAMIRVKGDSMFPVINSGDWVIFDRSRTGPADGIYLIRHEDELLVKQIAFFDAEIRIRSANRHWPEKAAAYSALEDPSILQIIGRVVWAGHLFS